jgi:hypothetical protein
MSAGFNLVVLHWRWNLIRGIAMMLLATITACQVSNATPTLLPGEVEIPFETVVLDEDGVAAITDGPSLIAVSNSTNAKQLETWVNPEAIQKLEQLDWDADGLLALFRVPGGGCSGLGVTVERLTRRGNDLTVHAFNWWPGRSGACAQTSLSAYHLIRVHKADANLDELEIILQIAEKEKLN